MKLWIYREARRRWFRRRPRYLVSIKLAVTDEQRAVIADHVLWRDELYISPTAADLDAKALSLLDLGDEVDGYDLAHVKKRMALQYQALKTARAAEGEFRVDVASALLGRTVVAHDVIETMMIEGGLRGGVAALQSKIERLLSHQRGDEEVHTGDSHADDASTPADWAEARRIKL